MQTLTTFSKILLLIFCVLSTMFLLWQKPRVAFANTEVTLNSAQTLTKPGDSLWAQIGSQLNLDHHADNPRVKKEIRKILADKKSFEAILARSGPYIYYVYSEAQKRNFPAEIALIPIIESEYNPNDHNSIGAMGLWQLMPATAKGLGVKVAGKYDGRRNVIISTQAAFKFIDYLGNKFDNNWNLAFAGYNCGPGCVSSAVKRANSTDYFKLSVPLETKLYVPRLLAVAEIIKHPEAYGVVLPPIMNTPYFKEVSVKSSGNLEGYSRSTGTNLEELKKLNPDFHYQKAYSTSDTLLVSVESRAI